MDKESTDLTEYFSKLAKEFADLLSENLLRDYTTTNEVMERIRKIREEIESYGWGISWNMPKQELTSSSVRITATLWRPRADLGPTEKKIYEEWLARNRAARDNK